MLMFISSFDNFIPVHVLVELTESSLRRINSDSLEKFRCWEYMGTSKVTAGGGGGRLV